ncbi:hypothetical protein G9C98_005689 [Cotesia typhae]|uniref:Longitudinals lacking protein n=1 Tax=Cotesia typhae TaxID=2053667 RepID=A0A8J5RDS8_9HYME|nr:hypothetical protein G9C98_005689 [Cotesia typhae]
MSMQQFCLRWNNHQPNFISVFSTLLTNETLVDVTLAAEGRHLQAHKVVLSACSTYFQSLFTVNPCQHPIVILKDVKFSDLKIMVDFMYYGEVNVSQEQLPSIIKTAENLKIKGLAEMHPATLTKWPSGSSDPSGGDRGESCSPTPSPMSPSFRRKRLRKSSTGSATGSGDKQNEEMSEITLVATNVVKPEPLIVSQENRDNIRRPVNTSTESQGSIDEDQISIMSNMESSTATTLAQSEGSVHDVSQQSGANAGQSSSLSSQAPAHQGLQWTIMEHTYPRFALSSCQTNLSIQASSAFTTPEISASSSTNDQYPGTNTTGSSCAMNSYPGSPHGLQHTSSSGGLSPSGQCSNSCQSPCASPQATVKRKRSTNPQADENFIRALDAVRYGGIGFCKAARMFGVNNRTLWLEYKKRGYPNNRPSVKSKVKNESNSSPPSPPVPPPVEPPSPSSMGPPTTPLSTHSAHSSHSVHSAHSTHSPHSAHNIHNTHTMIPTHTPHAMLGGYVDTRHIDYSLSNPSMPINLHAHHNKQVEGKRGRLLLMRQTRVKKESEPGHPSPDSEPGSPRIISSPAAHSVTPILNLPSSSHQWQDNEPLSPATSKQTLLTVTTCTNLLTVPQPSYLVKQHSHPLLPSQQQSSSSNYWIQRQHSNPEYPGRSTSPSGTADPIPLIKIEEGQTESRITKDTGNNSSCIRIIPAELLRSSSTPQLGSGRETRIIREDGSSDQRSGHCPVQREGPALGCNHCWNTVDTHGRTLRRKTKYHCPECQINLCIVPCFQEFHERQRENSSIKTLPKTSSI